MNAQDFIKGAYYDLENNRTDGYINKDYFSLVGGSNVLFHFKKSPSSERIKIKSSDVSSYVLEADSFAIITDVPINATTYVERDFAKVLEVGKISLYTYHSTVQSSPGSFGAVGFSYGYGIQTPILIKDGHCYRMAKNKDFKNTLPALIADCHYLAEKIEESDEDIDLLKLVKKYNSYFYDYVPAPNKEFGKIILYSRSKDNSELTQLTLNDSINIDLAPDTYHEFDFPLNSSHFTFSLDNGNDLKIKAIDSKTWRFVKYKFDKKKNMYTLQIPSIEEGEFDIYMIDKKNRKKK